MPTLIEIHSLIRVVLIQSCSARVKNFTNYVFCHPQFSGVIQNIENHCAIRAKFWNFDFWLYKIDYFYNIRHRQTGVKMAQEFSIFLITPLKCGWQNTYLIGEIFSSVGATLYKNPSDQTVIYIYSICKLYNVSNCCCIF